MHEIYLLLNLYRALIMVHNDNNAMDMRKINGVQHFSAITSIIGKYYESIFLHCFRHPH